MWHMTKKRLPRNLENYHGNVWQLCKWRLGRQKLSSSRECVISSILTYFWWEFRFYLNQGPKWHKLTQNSFFTATFFSLIKVFGLKGSLSVSQNISFWFFKTNNSIWLRFWPFFTFFEFFLYIPCYFAMCLQPPVFGQIV